MEIVMLLPGRHAARVRRQAAELLCRYLEGDITLVDEVCRLRGLQKDARQAALQLRRLVTQYADVDSNCIHEKFPDPRGRKNKKDTPAACVKGVVEIATFDFGDG